MFDCGYNKEPNPNARKRKVRGQNQATGTPLDFFNKLNERFKFDFDLAADSTNYKVDQYFTIEDDSLQQDWAKITFRNGLRSDKQNSGWLFLNPPFNEIAKWSKKCKEESKRGAKIVMLVPASVGSKWFQENVDKICSQVWFLRGRLKFQGHTQPYAHDCMICIYEPHSYAATYYAVWDWRK